MNFRWHTRALLAIASGAALALSFPNYNLWPLAWIAIALLALASIAARPAASPLYGFLHGLAFYPISVPWIDVVMRQYGNAGPWTAAGILALLAIAGGIICAAFSFCVAIVSRRRGAALACILAPFLWVALEFARAHLPIIAFPWNLTGYAATPNLPLAQLTTITGVYGLSFLIAAWGSLLAFAILSGRQRAWQALVAFTGAIVLVAIGGRYFLPADGTPRHVAHLVQTDFAQSESYPVGWMAAHAGDLAQLEQISVDAARRNPGLIVWPEVPAPFSFQDPAFAGRAQRIARDSGGHFLVGV